MRCCRPDHVSLCLHKNCHVLSCNDFAKRQATLFFVYIRWYQNIRSCLFLCVRNIRSWRFQVLFKHFKISLFYSFPFPFIHPAALKIKFVPTQPSHDYAFQKWKTVRVFSKELFNITFRTPANLFSLFPEELLTFIEESLREVKENNENIDAG